MLKPRLRSKQQIRTEDSKKALIDTATDIKTSLWWVFFTVMQVPRKCPGAEVQVNQSPQVILP